jgi:hypothetical protein
MKSILLEHYPRLKCVLSRFYSDELTSYTNWSLNTYALFVDLTITNGKGQFTAINIRNDSTALQNHYQSFIGFIWSEYLPLTYLKKYAYSNHAFNVFTEFANNNDLTLLKVKTSTRSISDSTKDCVDYFSKLDINQDLVEYYQGWVVISKDDSPAYIHLAVLHDTYGKEFTDKIFSAVSNYSKTLNRESLKVTIESVTNLFKAAIQICPSIGELEDNLQSSQVHLFFESIMNLLFAESQMKGNDARTFFKKWKILIKNYTTCFVETGIFEEPLKPLLAPKFIGSKDLALTFSTGGDLNQKEAERWLVNIPLYIKDDEAINIIEQRLERDLAHIRTISHRLFEEIKQRLARNKTYIKEGAVKPRFFASGDFNPRKQAKSDGYDLGNLKNTISTFYHYGFNENHKMGNYARFLGFEGQNNLLVKELSLPTAATIESLISLLVLEHPSITASWIIRWELFDKSGTQVGFRESGNQWIALSYKNRKGAMNAQQEIKLNDYSRTVVETLIQLTQFSRNWMRAKGDKNWRYMCITAKLHKADHNENLLKQLCNTYNTFNEAISEESYLPSGKILVTKLEAEEISLLVSLKTIRKGKGLQIYLKTQSLRAVSEALGHKRVHIGLLGSYLPKPLMDFFNARWVRQFQNAIVFEAMKDSLYLFDALDFEPCYLSKFLANHGIGELPDNIAKHAKIDATTNKKLSDKCCVDELTFTISTPLIQVLIAIQTVVDNADDEDSFLNIVTSWYESAVFILTSLSLESKSYVDIIPLYDLAVQNPLDLDRIKKSLLCRQL